MSDEPASDVDEQQVIGTQAAPASPAEREQQQAVADFNQKAESKGTLSMQVRVHSPFREYFDGSAFSLTAESATGTFDILPKHHNFISLLVPCELIIRTVEKEEHKILISGGLLHVKADQVVVFLDV